jgi:hypothetical protein
MTNLLDRVRRNRQDVGGAASAWEILLRATALPMASRKAQANWDRLKPGLRTIALVVPPSGGNLRIGDRLKPGLQSPRRRPRKARANWDRLKPRHLKRMIV